MSTQPEKNGPAKEPMAEGARPTEKEPKPAKPNAKLAVFEGLLQPDFGRDAKSQTSETPETARAPKRVRRASLRALIGLLVLLPACLTAGYMAFVAADQYHSSASFSVRSIDSSQGSDLIGMFTQASSGTTGSDSYVLLDYIRSERIVQEAEKALPFEAIFAVRGIDHFYGLRSSLPIEDKLDYWRSMVSANYDHTSGIINLEVKAFTPGDAQQIAAFIVQSCDRLINSLSEAARNEVLAVSEQEVQLSEARLKEAREAVRALRDTSQEVDPVEGARLAAQLLGTLEQQAVGLNAEISTALTQLNENTPRVRVLRSRLASVEQQITAARQRLGSGSAESNATTDALPGGAVDIASRILSFETLETEREFAERTYTAALSSLEKARIDANGRQRYLATFIFPTLSEFPQYPSRVLNVVLVLLGSLFVWGVAIMSYYNIRDRV